MSKIRIKNFGPIKEGLIENDGWIDINKVCIFIGNQGSGKSTIAKLISTFTWIEKAINRDEISTSLSENTFRSLFNYQNLYTFFKNNTILEYVGDKVHIDYNPVKFKENLEFPDNATYPRIKFLEGKNYNVPQIMYVPAERNFLSVIQNALDVRNLPNSLFDFAKELRIYQNKLKKSVIDLPINNAKYRFQDETENSFIIGDDFSINLQNASSGFQSLVPLYLVTKGISDAINIEAKELGPDKLSVNQRLKLSDLITKISLDINLNNDEKQEQIKALADRFINTSFINIVEEPEQNLYPSSQRQLLYSLIEFNNSKVHNKLIITTHSPYLINYLTHAVKASMVYEKAKSSNKFNDIREQLNKIVPINSVVEPNDWVVYELDGTTGSIIKLDNYNNLPSDENYLNNSLGDSNDLFIKLLEIEDLCQ